MGGIKPSTKSSSFDVVSCSPETHQEKFLSENVLAQNFPVLSSSPLLPTTSAYIPARRCSSASMRARRGVGFLPPYADFGLPSLTPDGRQGAASVQRVYLT